MKPEIKASELNHIGRSLIQFIHGGDVLHQERLDPFDHRQAESAIQHYLQIAGTKPTPQLTAKLFKQIQAAATTGTASESRKLAPLSFASFRDKYPALKPPVIDGVCREGETVNVIAASKVGKSWLSMDLAMSIATGRPWLGFTTEQGRVLLIDNELHPETLSSRLSTVQFARQYDRDELNENFHVESVRGQAFDLNKLALMLETLEANSYKAIILDAFYRFLPSGISENDNGQMMSLYNVLDSVAAKINCCFVVIHHASKGNQSDKAVTDVGSGAGSMSRATDTHLVIRSHAEEGYAVLEAAVRSFPPLAPVTIRYGHPCWELADLEPTLAFRGSRDAKQAKTDTDTTTAILSVLAKATKGMTTSQLRHKTGFGASRVNRGLFLLGESEQVSSRAVRRGGRRAEIYTATTTTETEK